MKLKADIRIQRFEVPALHAWLDNFAEGWVYWGSATAGELSLERSRQIMDANNEYAERSKEQGNSHLYSTIQVVLPNEQAAMLVKLSWPSATVERPSESNGTIGEQIARNS